jgi:hypothetical protein
MNLTVGIRALMGQIADLAHEKGFDNARVDVKISVGGELVVAVLIPPRVPQEWGPQAGFDRREAARLARLKRS